MQQGASCFPVWGWRLASPAAHGVPRYAARATGEGAHSRMGPSMRSGAAEVHTAAHSSALSSNIWSVGNCYRMVLLAWCGWVVLLAWCTCDTFLRGT
jgi:hypothetical protein